MSLVTPWCTFFQHYQGVVFIPRLVISNKGPVENGNRTGKHSLHWALGKALSQRWPEDGHWLWAAHITIDDRWLHATGTIGLHPPINGEGKAWQLFTEVLNHIISLQWNAYTISWRCCNFGISNLTIRKENMQRVVALQKERSYLQFKRLIFSHVMKWERTSGSPWTRTSISSSSWSSTTLRISSLIDFTYSSSEILKKTA